MKEQPLMVELKMNVISTFNTFNSFCLIALENIFIV